MVNKFLNNDGIIRYSHVREEIGLAWANNGREQGFDSIYCDFSTQFVGGVAKPYWPEVFYLICICTLRDKVEEGFI